MVEHFPMDELHTFTLSRADWELIVNALYEAAGDRLAKADAIGANSVYGAALYSDGQKYREVADYLDVYGPDSND